MTPTDIVNALVAFFPWGYIKLAVLVLVALYIVFAAVIVRQETLMSRVVEIPYSPLLRIIAVLHLVFSIVAFFLAFTLL